MFVPPEGFWRPNDQMSSVAFSPGNELAMRTVSLSVSLVGLFIVAFLLGKRFEGVAVRRSNGLSGQDLSSSLVLLLTSLSFLFFFFSTIMTHGIGLSRDQQACSIAFYGYIAFVSLTKFTFYAFLWDRTEPIWHAVRPKSRSFVWKVGASLIWLLAGVIISCLFGVFGRQSIVETNGQCRLGIRKEVAFVLLAIDILVVVAFIIRVASPLMLRSKAVRDLVVWKCLFGILAIPIITVATVVVPLILDSSELGWICLLAGACSSGALAIAASWMSDPPYQDSPLMEDKGDNTNPWEDPAKTVGISTVRLVARHPLAATSTTLPYHVNASRGTLESPYSIGMDPRDGAVDSISLDELSSPKIEDTPYLVPSPNEEAPTVSQVDYIGAPSPTHPLSEGPRRLSKARVKVKPYLSSISTAKSHKIDQWVPSTPVSPTFQLQSFQFPLPTPDSADTYSFAQSQAHIHSLAPHPFTSSEPNLAQDSGLYHYRHRKSSILDSPSPVSPLRIQPMTHSPVKGILKTPHLDDQDALPLRRPSIVQVVQNYWFPRRPSAKVNGEEDNQGPIGGPMRGHAYHPSSMGTLDYDYAETEEDRS